ncbi:uncharacterized protein LOC6046540 [Culex quinquefasciatus]|uniref:uncharacterized protein LOC6046540 n=1 Tax=Culex quinquefasciatus TaxID=7176 RepID=UPI0018E34A91|nr:uncharacterized protein LOC6046540 [Culex quinquefasciatus]
MMECTVRVRKLNRTTAALSGKIIQTVDIGDSFEANLRRHTNFRMRGRLHHHHRRLATGNKAKKLSCAEATAPNWDTCQLQQQQPQLSSQPARLGAEGKVGVICVFTWLFTTKATLSGTAQVLK